MRLSSYRASAHNANGGPFTRLYSFGTDQLIFGDVSGRMQQPRYTHSLSPCSNNALKRGRNSLAEDDERKKKVEGKTPSGVFDIGMALGRRIYWKSQYYE